MRSPGKKRWSVSGIRGGECDQFCRVEAAVRGTAAPAGRALSPVKKVDV